MSQRRSWGRLTRQPGRWTSYKDQESPDLDPTPTVPWFYAERMPEPWDDYLWHQWLSAWADILLGVCHNVWSKQGSRLYAAHRDHELKADLEDWLVVKAMEAAANFIPDPDHPNPHLQFAKFLYGNLNVSARWHFAEVVGDGRYANGAAAWAAHQSGIVSTDELDEAEAAEGFRVARHPLHGDDLMSSNPLTLLIRVEELIEQVTLIEREDRRAGFFVSASGTCLVNLCSRPVRARGLCKNHYQKDRNDALDRGDWETYKPVQGCDIDGCDQPHEARGRCKQHYAELRTQEAPRCSTEGCEKQAHSRGLCHNHYRLAREATMTTPCSQPGCKKHARTRGMCPMHYQRWRNAQTNEDTR